MEAPIEKPKHVSGRKARSIVRARRIVKQDITKEEFLANLGKVCQPISKESNESDSGKSGT